MNTGFIWGMIICVVSIIIIGIAIALYFVWKDRDDYDEDKKIIVWSVAAAGGLALIFGIIFVIWGAGKKESDDATQESIRQTTLRDDKKPPPPPPPKSIIAAPRPVSGPLYAKGMVLKTAPPTPPKKPVAASKSEPAQPPKGELAKPAKKVRFMLPGSSVTSKI